MGSRSEETLQRHLDDEVGNLRNEWNKANEQALDIAKLTIQSLIFLNGGGALAIPKLIEGSDKQFHVEAVCMLVCFGIGILLAVLAAVFAFFALGSRSDAIVKRIDQRYRSMERDLLLDIHSKNSALDGTTLASKANEKASAATKDAESFERSYVVFRFIGIALVLGSAVMVFIAGMFALAVIS